ncbi:hypothetical protein BC628DRAFT_1362651 [Trametes gibbosa]|nr:hypothetical protein BC628DRAFT_1362651 [Trametes gibbosa]
MFRFTDVPDDSILERLKDIGWGPEVEFLGRDGLAQMAALPGVRRSTKLTQSAWVKVLAVLDPLLIEARSRRLEMQHRTILRARFDALEEALIAHYVKLPRNPRMDCRPTYIDLAFTPECRAIIDVPQSETVTMEDFIPVISTVTEKWEDDLKVKLRAYIRRFLGDIAPGVDPITLAVAVFQCENSWDSLWWPNLLTHSCETHYVLCFRRAIADPINFKNDDAYTYRVKALYWKGQNSYHEEHRVLFRPDILQPSERALQAIARMYTIVSACGLDPARATIEDLERSDVWLRCLSCERRFVQYTPSAMLWKGAYQHYSNPPYSQVIDHEWDRADEDDLSLVRAALDSPPSTYWKLDLGLRLSCSLCLAFDSDPLEMKKHLQTIHDIDHAGRALRDGTIYFHPAVPLCRLPMVSAPVNGRGTAV